MSSECRPEVVQKSSECRHDVVIFDDREPRNNLKNNNFSSNRSAPMSSFVVTRRRYRRFPEGRARKTPFTTRAFKGFPIHHVKERDS